MGTFQIFAYKHIGLLLGGGFIKLPPKSGCYWGYERG